MKVAPDRIMKELKSISIFEYFSAYILVAVLFCALCYTIGKTIYVNELGGFLTGLGTFGIFVITLFQIPAAIDKYNRQRRRDKLAEFAYDLTDKSIKFMSAIRRISSPVVMSYESVTPETGQREEGRIDQFRNTYNNRINNNKQDLQNFTDITWKSIPFDDQELSDLVAELEKIWRSLWATAFTIMAFSNDREDLKVAKDFLDDWWDVSSKRKKRLEEIEKRLVEVLKKYY